MTDNIAALYVHGRIVTGTHHGDAYCKLSPAEKNEEICSGFYDQDQHKFVSNDKEFYLKKIILIRHADTECDDDPSITERGRNQIQRAAIFLNAFINLAGYQGFTSPIKRCQETAIEFNREIDLDFMPNEELSENQVVLRPQLEKLLEELPAKSILISHCNLIRSLAQLATGINTGSMPIRNCCILFADNGMLSQLGSL